MSLSIKRLAPDVASKIAAGEVAERPFNVVKELLENSLDAGASKITIEIADGGLSLVRITDNGKGISQNDLPLALERFATSKATSVEEVYNASTFGFRGEALAAVSAVSDFTLTSGIGDGQAYQIKSVFGGVEDVKPAPPITGTVAEAINLFENVPARRKFLKSFKSLENEITKLIKQFSLINPSAELILICDGKEVFRVSALEDTTLRASKVFTGKGFHKGEVSYGDKCVMVAVTLPSQSDRLKRDAIVIGVNGRLIKDASLIQAVIRAYYRLIPDGKFPCAAVDIRIPPCEVDANVHPAKMEVRFENQGEVFSMVSDAVGKAIDGKGVNVASVYSAITSADSIKFDNRLTVLEKELEFEHQIKEPDLKPMIQHAVPQYISHVEDDIIIPAHVGEDTRGVNSFESRMVAGEFLVIGQIDKTYILCETYDKHILFIDQHAAHERILFEHKLRAEAVRDKASIVLHEPLEVQVTQEVVDSLNVYAEVISGYGYAFVVSGDGGSVIITRIPFASARKDAGGEFLKIVEDLCLTGNSKTQDAPIALLSCKSAIKAGDDLTCQEMEYLVKLLFKTDNFGTCPHGRPIIYTMSVKKLAEKFLR